MMDRSKVYPEATVHLPNLNGGVINSKNGWWASGPPTAGIAAPPVMTSGR